MNFFYNLQEEGRGIALLVRKEMEPTLNDILSSTFSEHVFVDCTQGDGTLLTVRVIYRRPGGTSENDEKLVELIRNTAGMRKDNLLTFGDFSLPSINWDTESCRNNESHEASQFLQAYAGACLFQHQKETTRFREGEKPSVVDVVLTNKEDMIKDISTEAGLGKRDHFCLFITLNATTAENTQSARFCYSRTDESVLKDVLQKVKWEKELEDLSTNLAWDKIKEKKYEAIEESAPMTRPSGRHQKPWMNRETLASVRKKHELFRRWLATRNAQDYANYLKARNEARKACRKAQKNIEMKLASEAKTNPNGVWIYAKSKISCKSGILDLKKRRWQQNQDWHWNSWTSEQIFQERLHNWRFRSGSWGARVRFQRVQGRHLDHGRWSETTVGWSTTRKSSRPRRTTAQDPLGSS